MDDAAPSAGATGAHAPEAVDLVDTHCHLDAPQLADDGPATVIARAHAAGVTRMVTIGTDLATSRAAVSLAAAHAADGVWATVGIDPNDLDGWNAASPAALAELAASPRVVAVGEIGLDYHWLRSAPDAQRAAFVAQLAVARAAGLPVVVHSRDADEDTAAILLEWAAGAPDASRPLGVMHCFAGDVGLAKRYVAAGFVISLAGTVTYPSAHRTREVARWLPSDAYVLETDCPYLAPAPYRGQRNEPAYLRATATFVAELRGQSLAEVAADTSGAAARLFGWAA